MRRELRTLSLLALALTGLGCSGASDERPRWVVIGIDGADWGVIEVLWAEGKLPHLRSLAERGVRAGLATDYGISPVIWTTMATGVTPERHGVTDFVAVTPQGTVPVSSRTRRVPALWNILSEAERRVGVVGWWATWPAEPIVGVLVSDRAGRGLEREVHPPEMEAAYAEWRKEAMRGKGTFPRPVRHRDEPVALAAERLVAADFDLLLVYFNGVDTISHRQWRYWAPEGFPPAPAEEVRAGRAELVAVYEATDAAIGRLLAAAGPQRNALVVSDHGFIPQRPEKTRVHVDFDLVLERLGYQRRDGDGVDWSGTTLYTHGSATFRPTRRIRFALAGREPQGRVVVAERAFLRRRLEADLARVTYAGGSPAFGVRDAEPEEAAEGADFVVVVGSRDPSTELLHEGETWKGIVKAFSRVTGTHALHTAGILVAAGPDVAPGTDLPRLSIHDIAPTLLYGLGLPVADDFTGRPIEELFTERFRRAHPLRRVPTYGSRAAGETEASPADAELLRELEALGYLE